MSYYIVPMHCYVSSCVATHYYVLLCGTMCDVLLCVIMHYYVSRVALVRLSEESQPLSCCDALCDITGWEAAIAAGLGGRRPQNSSSLLFEVGGGGVLAPRLPGPVRGGGRYWVPRGGAMRARRVTGSMSSPGGAGSGRLR
jgi:hypothetical protein